MLKLLVSLNLWINDYATRIDERGATAVEYSILVMVVVILIFGSAKVIGDKIERPFNRVANSMPI